MKYLTVPAIGSGTQDDPYRPDIPEDTPFVGHYDPDSGTFLVAVPKGASIDTKDGVSELTTTKQKDDAARARNIAESDLSRWSIS